MAKVYIVFNGYSYDTFEGSWNGEDIIDSVWSEIESAKQRIKDLSNEYIEQAWYEDDGAIPCLDYKEDWAKDGMCVTYSRCPHEETTFYCEEHELRNGWVSEHKDLPAYFTTT